MAAVSCLQVTISMLFELISGKNLQWSSGSEGRSSKPVDTLASAQRGKPAAAQSEVADTRLIYVIGVKLELVMQRSGGPCLKGVLQSSGGWRFDCFALDQAAIHEVDNSVGRSDRFWPVSNDDPSDMQRPDRCVHLLLQLDV